MIDLKEQILDAHFPITLERGQLLFCSNISEFFKASQPDTALKDYVLATVRAIMIYQEVGHKAWDDQWPDEELIELFKQTPGLHE